MADISRNPIIGYVLLNVNRGVIGPPGTDIDPVFCWIKSEIPRIERGKSGERAKANALYVAQPASQFDAACPVGALAKREDCEKGPFPAGNKL